jgi:hypothetical protein
MKILNLIFIRSFVARLLSNVIHLCWFGTILLAANVALAADIHDHDSFDDMLLKNVRNGFVDYDGLAADPRLETYVAQIGAADASKLRTDNDKLAFYINAYNALAIKGILDGYSPRTLFGRYQFFKRNKYVIAGEKFNLFNFEHERIIAIDDPRIHFSIVCASISCPRLSSRAYTPEEVDTQLHEAARNFLNDPTRNRFDLDRRIAFVSMIFKWYAEDFEAAAGSLQQYMARFVDDARVQDALRLGEFELKYEKYDWNLNGQFSAKK